MIIDPNTGKPTAHDGPTGRVIAIQEMVIKGRPTWAIDFAPAITAFEFEEVMMILGDVTRGIAQQALSKVHEARHMAKLKQELNKEK